MYIVYLPYRMMVILTNKLPLSLGCWIISSMKASCSISLLYTQHFSITLDAYLCWLNCTIFPVNLLIIWLLSCGVPLSRTCCNVKIKIKTTIEAEKGRKKGWRDASNGWLNILVLVVILILHQAIDSDYIVLQSCIIDAEPRRFLSCDLVAIKF